MGADDKEDPKASKPKLAILHLINVQTGNPLPILTGKLRTRLSRLPDLDVLSKDDMEKTLRNYDKSLEIACNGKECAFEFGSLLQCNFILFGSASQFEDMGLVTVKILDVKRSSIIWSRVLTSHRSQSAIEANFITLYKELIALDLRSVKKGSDDILAVLDFSDSSYQADILFERILTHSYDYGYADVMSPEEVRTLIDALGIDKDTVLNSIETILNIGDNLGVQGVLYTQLNQRGAYLKHQIALFNIPEKSVVLSMPPLPQANFKDILAMESHFFKALGQRRR